MRTLLLAVLVLALAAAAWVLLARGGGPGEVGTPLLRPGAPTPTPAADLPAAQADSPPADEAAAPGALVAARPPGARLASVGLLRGRVVDGQAAALAGASVLLLEGGAGPWASGEELRLGQQTTNSDGRFAFAAVPAGRELSLLVGLGARRRWMPSLATDEAAVLDLGDVVLAGPVTLRGHVVDERGAPLPGARVCVGDLRAACEVAARIMSAEFAVDFEQLFDEATQASATSDAAGAYAVEGLHPGAIGVLARAPGRADVPAPVMLGADGATYDITLRAGAMLAGRVVSTSGEPVAGALVGATGITMWFAHSTTRKDGRFELLGLDGPVDDLIVSASGFAPAELEGVEPDTRDLLVTLQPLGGARVTVLAPDGRPAADATLRILALREGFLEDLLEISERWSYAAAERDTPGIFELRGLPHRRHLVLATSRDGLLSAPEWITPSTPPAEATLQLARPRRVHGRLTDAESGEPIPGAEVRLLLGSTPDTDPDGPDFTDGDGRFGVDVPTAAACGLLFSSARHVDASVPVTLGSDELAPVLQPAGSVRVFILPETAGSTHGPVSVKLEPRSGGDGRRARYVVESCVFSRLPPGNWDVTVSPETWLGDSPTHAVSTTVTVLARRQAVVEL